jgi:hypothetical protein
MPNFSKAFLKTLVLMRSSLKILNVEWSWLLMSWFFFTFRVALGVVWCGLLSLKKVRCSVVWFGSFGLALGVVWCGLVNLETRQVWCGLAKYFEKSVVWCGVASQTPNYGAHCYIRNLSTEE